MEELKTKIEEIVNKIKGDENIAKSFQENPVGTVEKLIGVDLPDDKINEVVAAVKTKVGFDNGGILGAVKGLF